MINRKRDENGYVYFETNDGIPVKRVQANDMLGSICFRKDDDFTYKYDYSIEEDKPKIVTYRTKIVRNL